MSFTFSSPRNGVAVMLALSTVVSDTPVAFVARHIFYVVRLM